MTVDRLIHTLQQLDDHHREMIDIANEKKQAIIKDDVNGIIQIMNQESRILKKIEISEAERIVACNQLLKDRGIKSQLNLTITELTRLVFDPEEKQKLQQAQLQLSTTLAEVKQINDLNQQLIQQSLNFLEFSLELFGGRQDQEVTYHHPADKFGGVQRPGLFDTRG
jgi:flagellar biosynthesis/type III secretory pathway chaperone